MYVSRKDLDTISEALDFISTNTDNAEDREYYDDFIGRLCDLKDKMREQAYRQHKPTKKQVAQAIQRANEIIAEERRKKNE